MTLGLLRVDSGCLRYRLVGCFSSGRGVYRLVGLRWGLNDDLVWTLKNVSTPCTTTARTLIRLRHSSHELFDPVRISLTSVFPTGCHDPRLWYDTTCALTG